jgi:hypothetical protein
MKTTFASFARFGALAATIAIGGSIATPAVALADSASTAAIAVGIGAIVGTLIYDNNRHQYYYVRGGRNYYVNNNQAQQWYQRRDPQYYNAHRSDFRNNPSRFDQGFRQRHPH